MRIKIRPKISPKGQKILIRAILILSFLFLLTALYFSPWIQKNRYVQTYKIERIAKKFPVGSDQYSRYMAIADAIRRGDKTYAYTPNFNPMGPGPNPQ